MRREYNRSGLEPSRGDMVFGVWCLVLGVILTSVTFGWIIWHMPKGAH